MHQYLPNSRRLRIDVDREHCAAEAVSVVLFRIGNETTRSENSTEECAGPKSTNVHRIRARDLQAAREEYARVQREMHTNESGSRDVELLVDVEVLLAQDHRAARRLREQFGDRTGPASVQYIGTPRGLASLIADIHAAQVADGVTLRPIAGANAVRHMLASTIPILRDHGWSPFVEE